MARPPPNCTPQSLSKRSSRTQTLREREFDTSPSDVDLIEVYGDLVSKIGVSIGVRNDSWRLELYPHPILRRIHGRHQPGEHLTDAVDEQCRLDKIENRSLEGAFAVSRAPEKPRQKRKCLEDPLRGP